MKLFHIDDNALACRLGETDSLPEKGYLWLLLERKDTFDLPAWLARFGYVINERHIEDYTQFNHASSYDCMKAYDIIVFRNVSERKEGRIRQFDTTTFIIFKRLLITVYDNDNLSLEKIVSLYSEENRSIPNDPEVMAECCMDFFVNRFLEVKQGIDIRLAAWQKKLLQAKRSPDWSSLIDFKTDVRRLRMLCEEQQDAINAWRANLRLDIHKDHHHEDQLLTNLNDVAEHSNRMVKLITQSQQELESLMQLHFTILSHRTNEIMRTVALITGIFLPANLIAGIFGMNFKYQPVFENLSHGFIFAMTMMLTISGSLLCFFWWKKWL
ncbi:MAG: magnesium transporter CorA family protein [Gammaproteobacteria bacterium]|jgi:magnesium transporter|nr:magnesium transporter CorA family protein [Gammaproteobacteria bacterium]